MIPKGTRQQGLKIQVLAGGISHERDISLKSGRRLADALTDAGIWRDDSQVIRLHAGKDYTDAAPGAYITVHTIDEEATP